MENTLLENTLSDEKENFKIDSFEKAVWVFKKLRSIAAEEAKVKDTAEKEMAPIIKWRDEELAQYKKDKEYFSYLLEEYYRSERAKDSKFKLSTPYGKATSSTRETYFYDDEEAIIKYCTENDIEAIREKRELDKNTFKKLLPGGINLKTGEVVPGVRVEEVTNVSIKVVE